MSDYSKRTFDGATRSTPPQGQKRRARKPAPPPRTVPVSQRQVCVYCGSGSGNDPTYAKAANTLGTDLAKNGVGLVYGGGGLGLMGTIARATLDAGGHVTGIIPEFLTAREHMLEDVNRLIVTEDMHERKKTMFEQSDAFVALPGGIGTLEELVEQLTWFQLGRHEKPIVIANIENFWKPFLDLLAHMREEAFIRTGLDVSFTVVNRAEDILPALLSAWEAEASVKVDAEGMAKF